MIGHNSVVEAGEWPQSDGRCCTFPSNVSSSIVKWLHKSHGKQKNILDSGAEWGYCPHLFAGETGLKEGRDSVPTQNTKCAQSPGREARACRCSSLQFLSVDCTTHLVCCAVGWFRPCKYRTRESVGVLFITRPLPTPPTQTTSVCPHHHVAPAAIRPRRFISLLLCCSTYLPVPLVLSHAADCVIPRRRCVCVTATCVSFRTTNVLLSSLSLSLSLHQAHFARLACPNAALLHPVARRFFHHPQFQRPRPEAARLRPHVPHLLRTSICVISTTISGNPMTTTATS
jgi:hypothetical protein